MNLHRRVALALIFFTLCFQLLAQKTAPLYLGTKTIYQPLQTKHTAPPRGFTPVFINYVGRHGARFMTKPGSDILITDILQQAAKQKALTQTGKEVWQAMMQFNSAEKNNYGNITKLGEAEQTGIAGRMYNEYKNVFKQQETDVLTTTKVRTQQSATAFLQGLPNKISGNIYQTIIADSADAMLRFYDLSPAYDNYKNSKVLQQHLDSLQDDRTTKIVADRIIHKLFSDSFCKQFYDKRIGADNETGKRKSIDVIVFAQALYDIYTIWFSAIKEMQQACTCTPNNAMQSAFTKEDLQWLDRVNSAEDFYEKGAGEDTSGIQVTIAAPLLVNFINTTDSVINKTKRANSVLRFTHAEAISPFATLLGIPEASVESRSVYTFQQHWKASQIIPLSANIQWIIYRNHNKYLVKILLNEKEVKLPVSTSDFPYYNWQMVRQYYVDKLNRLGVDLHGDMIEYLLRKE